MATKSTDSFSLYSVTKDNKEQILKNWVKTQLGALSMRLDLISAEQIENESREFLIAFIEALSLGKTENVDQKSFDKARTFLGNISRSRALKGFSPSETATFVFSLKEVTLPYLVKELSSDPKLFLSELTLLNDVIDKLGLYTFEVYSKSREDVVSRQSRQIMEMATPIIQIWDSILAVPLIGTLDSARTQIVMEKLLEIIVEQKSKVAIIDITGVPTVDTMVAQHLMKTVSAIKLLGSDSVITGISAPIAQTMVQMGVEFKGITTRAIMADGIRYALEKLGKSIDTRK
ncbi:MAG: STAS domain-containing protein [Bacteroidetes bacterium]|nr:STAS domain-containing protein [Bacteroidota bacterium]